VTSLAWPGGQERARAASVHVSNILAKLGEANRAEAAVASHRLGLGADDGPTVTVP